MMQNWIRTEKQELNRNIRKIEWMEIRKDGREIEGRNEGGRKGNGKMGDKEERPH